MDSPWKKNDQRCQKVPGLVNIQKATWTMAIEIVDLPMKNGDFPVRYVNVYRRVSKHGDVKLGDC